MPRIGTGIRQLTASAPAASAAAQGVELNGNTLELTDSASPQITKNIVLEGDGSVSFSVQVFTTAVIDAATLARLKSAGTVELFGDDVKLGSSLASIVRLTGNEIQFDNDDVDIIVGAGDPEGAITASPGSLFLRNDGGSGNAVYVKELGTGNTGWQKVISASGVNAAQGVQIRNGVIELAGAGATTVTKNIDIFGNGSADFAVNNFNNLTLDGGNQVNIISSGQVQTSAPTTILGSGASPIVQLVGSELQFDGDDVDIIAGSGIPEGAITASPGSLFLRNDGGAGNSVWVKESGTGNTGWQALRLVAGEAMTVDGNAIELGSATPVNKTIQIVGQAGFDFGVVTFDDISLIATVDVLLQGATIVLNSDDVTIGTDSTSVVTVAADDIQFGPSGDDVHIQTGTGSPEGVVTAGVGSIFLREDGGAGTTFYVKESGTGNTGWVAK